MSNWDEIDSDAGASGAHETGASVPRHEDGVDVPHDAAAVGAPEAVEDVTPRKPQKKKNPFFIVLGVTVLVVGVLLYSIFSRVMGAMNPSSGGQPVEAVSPMSSKQDSVDIPGVGSVPQGGGLLEPAPAASAGTAPGQPGSVEAMLPTTPGQVAQAKAADVQAQATPVQPAAAVGGQPAVAAQQQLAPAPVANAGEVDRLKSDLEKRSREVDELKDALATCKKSAESAKVCTATPKSVPAKSQSLKPGKAPKKTEPEETVIETSAPKHATAKRKSQNVAKASTKPANTGKGSAGGDVVIDETKDAGRLLLTRYRIYAIYPNVGEHQSAHLVSQSGQPLVVRVGDSIGTARVKKIDAATWEVQTTEGVIH